MRRLPRSALAIASLALLGATPLERETKPGEGVLCMGGFIYFAQIQAKACHAGKDAEYQQRLDRYVERLDAYLIRNLPEGEASLKNFKNDQALNPGSRPELCSYDEDYKIYEAYRDMPAEKLDAFLDKLLERDGPPTFGDCV